MTETKQNSEGKFTPGVLRAATEICLRIASVVGVAIPSDIRDKCAQIIYDETQQEDWRELLDASDDFLPQKMYTLEGDPILYRKGLEAEKRLQVAIAKVEEE